MIAFMHDLIEFLMLTAFALIFLALVLILIGAIVAMVTGAMGDGDAE